MPVGFGPEGKWNDYTECYRLWAVAGGELIVCVIPTATFATCFDTPQPTLADIERLFQRHRRSFEAAFRQMIEAGDSEWWPDPLAEDRRRQAVLTPARFAAFASPETAITLLMRQVG